MNIVPMFERLANGLITVHNNGKQGLDRFTYTLGEQLVISNPVEGCPDLSITVVAHNLLLVEHGEEMSVAFFTTLQGWIPVGEKKPYSDYYKPFAALDQAHRKIVRMNMGNICKLAQFCDVWWYGQLKRQSFAILTPETMRSVVNRVPLESSEKYLLSC